MPFTSPLGSGLVGALGLLMTVVPILHSQQLTVGAIGIQLEDLNAVSII